MSDNRNNGAGKPGALDRRSVMAGGAATAATATLPRAAPAQSGDIHSKSAVYMDPDYMDTFNKDRYASGNIQAVHDKIKYEWFPNRADLKWGLYQQRVEPDYTKWGRNGRAAFDNWPDFMQEARDDLEKLPARFSNPANAMDPFDPSRVAPNMMEHLDEVIRIALWDHHDVTVSIKVDKKRKRHHEFKTKWNFTGSKLASLEIDVWCPDGGWQGYTWWPHKRATDHIRRLVATWNVPPPPSNNTGQQIIFIFNGLESRTGGPNAVGGILQPVLQWTNAGWAVRSWYVRADFDPLTYSQLPDPSTAVGQADPIFQTEHRCYSKAVTQLREGQTITGTIQGGPDLGGKFNYSCWLEVDNRYQSSTLLSLADIPELSVPVCAVESYGVRASAGNPDYPAVPITMTAVELQVDGYPVSPIQWKESKKRGHDYFPRPTMGGRKIEFRLV